jgi:hypothetical protein
LSVDIHVEYILSAAEAIAEDGHLVVVIRLSRLGLLAIYDTRDVANQGRDGGVLLEGIADGD